MSENCDCCSGTQPETPAAEINPPAQAALNYRVGTHGSFLETMLARLSGFALEPPAADGGGGTLAPLARLSTRDPSDPSIALLDAWATVADVLSFYQERIANEGYLPTAQQRRSVLELARLIGYRPRPGVAASVKLAFTVAGGFDGTIPAGTRAQSIPGTGETPQFFETSADLAARDQWNTLAPRLTRPQLITPAMSKSSAAASSAAASSGDAIPLVTGADVIDTVYLDGIANNLKPGDAVFFVFGPNADPGADPPQQYLRLVADVDVQAKDQRTLVTLGLQTDGRSAADELQLYADKATYLFAGSDLAQQVTDILQPTIANIKALSQGGYTTTETLDQTTALQSAMARITLIRGVALKRGFSRIAAWLAMLLRAMQWMSLGKQSIVFRFEPIFFQSVLGVAAARGADAEPIQPQGIAVQPLASSDYGGQPLVLEAMPAASHPSPLARLGDITAALDLAPSVQPANALRLRRSVAGSFTPQSDLAPRLITALHPRLIDTLYPAWSALATPAGRVEVHAARVKAGLFAASWAGPSSTTRDPIVTSFTDPTITSAWSNALPGVGGSTPQLTELPLDAAYELIKPGSWVAIDRPNLDSQGNPDGTRKMSYHVVQSLRTANLAAGNSGTTATKTGTGYAAKVSLLTLAPQWLSDLDNAAFSKATASTTLLRETIVHAQSEPLKLAEEPLDADIQGDSIDLAKVYDGIEPGRWVMVSGTRTDIPNVSGVNASELAMIAGVAQGAQAPSCVMFPGAMPPFGQIYYTSDANAYGDRLVVGQLTAAALGAAPGGGQNATAWQPRFFQDSQLPLPALLNQQFCDQVQLAPGVYANAYVPTQDERGGNFSAFAGLLVDPDNNVPYSGGRIPATALAAGVFAWRVSSQALHTILNLASPLAYKYDRCSITLYGNVTDATHGQSTGEVLGNGDAAQAFQSFAPGQAPLTYVSAPTPSGAVSSLSVRVNELQWHELQQLSGAAPGQRVYVTRQDDAQKTGITFGNGVHGARLPTGTANVKASYRYGIGKAGNVQAGQISQLATHPLGAQGVINPLPASGGADADSLDQARANAPVAVLALDRLVSVRDYADFARTYAGIGKAVAAHLSDGRRQLVHVTVAGAADIPIDPSSQLHANLLASLRRYGDPYLAVAVDSRRVRLLVMAATVGLQPDYAWEEVEPRLRAAVLAQFAFDARGLGQSAFLSEAIGVMQGVAGIAHVNLTTFDSVADSAKAAALAALGSKLRLRQHVRARLARLAPHAAAGTPAVLPAELVYLTPDIPGTLLLAPA